MNEHIDPEDRRRLTDYVAGEFLDGASADDRRRLEEALSVRRRDDLRSLSPQEQARLPREDWRRLMGYEA